MRRIDRFSAFFLAALFTTFAGCAHRHSAPAATGAAPVSCKVTTQWSNVTAVSRSTPTLQVVVNPPLRRGSRIHDRVFAALKSLDCDYVRYVPWLPYPKLAVAELEPPASGRTSWDFSLIDPMMADFMNATAGHSVVINFSTIPEWMFKTPHPVPYPSDANQAEWHYEQGEALRDPSMKEVAEYYGRLVSWYTKGGFKDQLGREHASGHHYSIGYWEVLNEVDFEHRMSPQFYTALYDAITAAIHRADPRIKFVGMALADPARAPQFFDYFLNHKNHRGGAPLDMISYHFYASPPSDENPNAWPYTFFDQANGFLTEVRYIQAIRDRLSPATKTDIDEIGAILPNDNVTPRGPIPHFYWNLCGSLYAYLYGHLASLGVEAVGESQLVGYPSQFPSVSLVNWSTGQPNARYWTLQLLHNHFRPGDKLVETQSSASALYAQGFVTPDGKRELLLVNLRERAIAVTISGAAGGAEEYVDQTTGERPPDQARIAGDKLTLGGFGVAVVTMRNQ
ncbi:MAG: glycosyl hydrolase family 39 [Terriglobia bacterium]